MTFKYIISFIIFLTSLAKISFSQSKKEINKLIDEALTHGKQSVYTNSGGQTPTFYSVNGVDSKNPKFMEVLTQRGFSSDKSLVDIQYLTSSSFMQYLRSNSNNSDGLLFFDSKFIPFFNELKPVFENIDRTFYCARLGAEPCIYTTIKQMVTEKSEHINIFKNYCFWKYSIKGCTEQYITSQCYRLAKEIKEIFPNDKYPITDEMLEKTKLYYKDKDEASYRFLTNMTKSLESFVSSPSNSNSSSSSNSSNNSDKEAKQEISRNNNQSDFDKCEKINVPSVKKVGERGVSGFSYTYLIEFSDGIYGTLYLGDPSNKYFISDGVKNYYYKSYSSALNALYRYKKCEFISKIERD